MHRQTGSTLVVLARHLMGHVTIHYALWWHGATGATYTAVHILGSPPLSSRKKKSSDGSSSEESEDPSLFGEPSLSRGGRRRGAAKRARGKKVTKTPPAESGDMGDYFADFDIDVGESTTKRPPL